MRSILGLMLILVSWGTGFGQQDSLADVFPLGKNKWTYGFNTWWHAGGYHYAENDTGKAEYEIIGVVPSVDSTRWQFVRRRDFIRYAYSGVGTIPPGPKRDTSSFEIVELKTGRHALYSPTFDVFNVFPFANCFSTRFVRYTPVDTAGYLTMHVTGHCALSYDADLVLRRDTGVVQMVGHSYYGNSYDFRNYLSSFERVPYIVGAKLSYPQDVVVAPLVGIPKDTVLVLENIGTDTLHIQSLTSSDPALVTTLYSYNIPPYHAVPLEIWYRSFLAGKTVAKIRIVSNSISSPDTILVAFVNRMAAATQFDRRNIDFGEFDVLRRYKETTLTITNTGNVGLAFDSIKSTNPDFTVRLEMNVLPPGQTRACTIRFTPSPPFSTRKNASILFFTNSLYSPDTVRASGHGHGDRFEFEPRSIDFGGTRIKESDTNSVTIRNGFFLGIRRDPPSNPSFAFLSNLPISFLPIYPYTPFLDSIRFTPNSTGPIRGYVVYFSNNGDLIATDTIWLTGIGMPSRITLSDTSVDFGKVTIGSHRDMVLTITNADSTHQAIVRDFPTSDSDPSFSLTMAPAATIAPYSIVRDTIRFAPSSPGDHSIIAVYRFESGNIQVGSYSVHMSGVGERAIPTQYFLNQNYPNPFNPGTTIRYELPKPSHIRLSVFNTLGQEVSTLVDASEEPGYKSVQWNASGVSNGVYFYRLTAGDFVSIKKMLLLK